MIRLYQIGRAGAPRRCRFFPTCSDYALDALKTGGLFVGGWMACLRLLKCHPWHPGGYDPVQRRI